jgi:hypothetical protein
MKTSTEELKRLAEAVLKAYSGLSWQVTMVRNEHGVTHYHIRSHSEPGIAVIKDQYWEDDHIPSVDHYGYIQPDDRMDCDVFRVDIARLIAAANPAAVLELIAEVEALRKEVKTEQALSFRAQVASLEQQRDELLAALKDAREMVSDWAGYASPYFQEKHDIDGDMKKLDDAIARMEG